MYLTKSRISFFFFWKDRDLELPEKEFFFFSYRERHPKNVAVKC